MSEGVDMAKAASFREYRKSVKLLRYNQELRRPFFVDRYQRRIDELEKQYPDFPAALTAQEEGAAR